MRIFHLCAIAAVAAAVFAVVCIVRTKCGVTLPVCADMTAAEPEIKPVPLGEDELSALRWLDCVTGELPPAQEREWWGAASVRQFGLFALRYTLHSPDMPPPCSACAETTRKRRRRGGFSATA